MRTILDIRKISTTLAAAAGVVGLLLVASLAGAGPALHHASGGGNFEVTNDKGQVNDFMVAFNASQLKEGGAKGQLEFHNLTNSTSLHLMIVRLEFLGDATVGLIGQVTKSVRAGAEVGQCRAIKLQDNGEGKKAEPDQSSKLFNPKAYKYTCHLVDIDWTDKKLNPIELDRGNIQIR